MIVVTGGAGFIGSCVIAGLNQRGRGDITIVDHLQENDLKKANIAGKQYRKYFEKDEFLALIRKDQIKEKIEAVIHMGACSSTTLQDADYFEKNNFEYSCYVADWALKRRARFIYASSAATYGDGNQGYRDDEKTMLKLQPLNLYGVSKQKFDLWIWNHGLIDQVVGLKFFNVFGPNEYHKGDMQSIVAKSYQRVVAQGKIGLFKSYHPKYKDGEQKRDFIYVKDAVDIVLFFLDHPDVNGIFNVGTGQANTWNDLAAALFAAVGRKANIEYIEMPESLRPRYQYFTQAEMTRLRQAGYDKPFTPLLEAVKDYGEYLRAQRHF